MDSHPAEVQAPTCLLLADRHHGLLEGVQSLLGSRFQAVVTVSDEPSLMEGTRRLRPTLAVLDLSLAPDGLGMLRRLRTACPDQKVVVLSLHDSLVAAGAALRAGADAFVLKRALAEDLLSASEAVLSGHRYCSPAVLAAGTATGIGYEVSQTVVADQADEKTQT
jgi:two-component system secretion response regulator SsrB